MLSMKKDRVELVTLLAFLFRATEKCQLTHALATAKAAALTFNNNNLMSFVLLSLLHYYDVR